MQPAVTTKLTYYWLAKLIWQPVGNGALLFAHWENMDSIRIHLEPCLCPLWNFSPTKRYAFYQRLSEICVSLAHQFILVIYKSIKDNIFDLAVFVFRHTASSWAYLTRLIIIILKIKMNNFHDWINLLWLSFSTQWNVCHICNHVPFCSLWY